VKNNENIAKKRENIVRIMLRQVEKREVGDFTPRWVYTGQWQVHRYSTMIKKRDRERLTLRVLDRMY
jgi:hypothetical protein